MSFGLISPSLLGSRPNNASLTGTASCYAATFPFHWEALPNPGDADAMPKASWHELSEDAKFDAVLSALLPYEALNKVYLQKSGIIGIVEQSFPFCDEIAHVVFLVRYTAWMFKSDDDFEDLTAKGEHDRAAELVAAYSQILDDACEDAIVDDEAQPKSCRLFAQLVKEACQYAANGKNNLLFKLRRELERYWEGVLEEGDHNHNDNITVTVEKKIAVTHITVYLVFLECFAVPGADLPEDVEGSFEVQYLQQLCSLLVGLFNDILSFVREKEDEVHTNVALAISAASSKPGSPVSSKPASPTGAFPDFGAVGAFPTADPMEGSLTDQDVCELTLQLHNTLVFRFDELAEEAIAEHNRTTSNIGTFVESCRRLILGSARGQIGSPRYATKKDFPVTVDFIPFAPRMSITVERLLMDISPLFMRQSPPSSPTRRRSTVPGFPGSASGSPTTAGPGAFPGGLSSSGTFPFPTVNHSSVPIKATE